MADNYLERRMEEYRNGTLAQSLRRSVAMTRKRPKTRYEALHALVVCHGLNADAEKLIRTFAARRCRISFASNSRTAGSTLAQSCGARFYPIDEMSDEAVSLTAGAAAKHYGSLNAIIYCGEEARDLRRIAAASNLTKECLLLTASREDLPDTSHFNTSDEDFALRCLTYCANTTTPQ